MKNETGTIVLNTWYGATLTVLLMGTAFFAGAVFMDVANTSSNQWNALTSHSSFTTQKGNITVKTMYDDNISCEDLKGLQDAVKNQ